MFEFFDLKHRKLAEADVSVKRISNEVSEYTLFNIDVPNNDLTSLYNASQEGIITRPFDSKYHSIWNISSFEYNKIDNIVILQVYSQWIENSTITDKTVKKPYTFVEGIVKVTADNRVVIDDGNGLQYDLAELENEKIVLDIWLVQDI